MERSKLSLSERIKDLGVELHQRVAIVTEPEVPEPRSELVEYRGFERRGDVRYEAFVIRHEDDEPAEWLYIAGTETDVELSAVAA